MSPRAKNVLFAAITMFGSVTLVLLLGEIAVRIWGFQSDLQPDPDVIRSHVPNYRRPVNIVERKHPFNQDPAMPEEEATPLGFTSINNLGFPMLDDVEDKRPGEQRIMLLGDSYLASLEVDAKDKFSEIVSRRLDEETHGRWKIINAGVSSGSPLQYLMLLHHWADRIQPDLVIVFLGANDGPDDIRARERYGVVTDETGIPIRPAKQFSLRLIRISHLARYFARQTLTRIPNVFSLLSPPKIPEQSPQQTASPDRFDAWMDLACDASEPAKQMFLDGSGQYLRMLRDVSERLGAGFAVVLVHYSWYFPDEPFYTERWSAEILQALQTHGCVASEGKAYEAFVRGFLRENEIEFASTYDRFMDAKKRNPRQKLWHYYDYHYNREGHVLVAEELYQLVQRMIEARERAE
jgi:lysophospholipase L1-like esterase